MKEQALQETWHEPRCARCGRPVATMRRGVDYLDNPTRRCNWPPQGIYHPGRPYLDQPGKREPR